MKKPEKSIKSAYELAMERLESREGRQAPVSDATREALAAVDAKAKADVAEVEIMYGQRRAVAEAQGEDAALAELERARRRDLNRIREDAEVEKRRLRGG